MAYYKFPLMNCSMSILDRSADNVHLYTKVGINASLGPTALGPRPAVSDRPAFTIANIWSLKSTSGLPCDNLTQYCPIPVTNIEICTCLLPNKQSSTICALWLFPTYITSKSQVQFRAARIRMRWFSWTVKIWATYLQPLYQPSPHSESRVSTCSNGPDQTAHLSTLFTFLSC